MILCTGTDWIFYRTYNTALQTGTVQYSDMFLSTATFWNYGKQQPSPGSRKSKASSYPLFSLLIPNQNQQYAKMGFSLHWRRRPWRNWLFFFYTLFLSKAYRRCSEWVRLCLWKHAWLCEICRKRCLLASTPDTAIFHYTHIHQCCQIRCSK